MRLALCLYNYVQHRFVTIECILYTQVLCTASAFSCSSLQYILSLNSQTVIELDSYVCAIKLNAILEANYEQGNII